MSVLRCQHCGNQVLEGLHGSPMEDRVERALRDFQDWDEYCWDVAPDPHGYEEWRHQKLPHSLHVPDLGDVTLVDMDLKYDFEYSANPIWMIFKVGEEFYRKSGYADSYGGQRWDGPFRLVKKQEAREQSWVRT